MVEQTVLLDQEIRHQSPQPWLLSRGVVTGFMHRQHFYNGRNIRVGLRKRNNIGLRVVGGRCLNGQLRQATQTDRRLGMPHKVELKSSQGPSQGGPGPVQCTNYVVLSICKSAPDSANPHPPTRTRQVSIYTRVASSGASQTQFDPSQPNLDNRQPVFKYYRKASGSLLAHPTS